MKSKPDFAVHVTATELCENLTRPESNISNLKSTDVPEEHRHQSKRRQITCKWEEIRLLVGMVEFNKEKRGTMSSSYTTTSDNVKLRLETQNTNVHKKERSVT